MSEPVIQGSGESPSSAAEWRVLLSVALPVVVVQVGLVFMGVVDTLMLGRVSPTALAAGALGNLYVFTSIVVAMGTLMALDPLVSQALGARDETGVRRAIQRGLVLAVLLGIVTMAAMAPVEPILRLFRQPAEVIPGAARYSYISAAGLIPFLLFVVLRQSLQAMHRLAPIVLTVVASNLLNAGGNYLLIFGHAGIAPMGVAGAAVSTAISRWAGFFLLLFLAWHDLRPHVSTVDRAAFRAGPLARMLVLGLPIGLQQFLEVSAFAAVGLLMGTFGALQVASHQIALNMASLTFMVPLGVGAAAAVRVGHAIGAEDERRSKRAARLSYLMGAGFMTVTAAVFLLLPAPLSRMYTSDASVIAIAASLVPIAGVFQIFDGLQAVGAGVLRGLGDTRVPLIAMLSGYWLIGVPVSVVLAFTMGLGPQGLWWGFVAGLASVALFLLWRVRVVFRLGVRRLHIDSGTP